MTVPVGIVGATGYAGQELVRLLARHPGAALDTAMASDRASSASLPGFDRIWEGPVVPLSVPDLVDRVAAVFLTVPEALAAEIGPPLLAAGVRVFDLSGAFRLVDDAERQRWYPESGGALPCHTAYGLAERHRGAIRDARLVACAGCYPTAAILALAPLARQGLLAGPIVIDAKSGISGAGKSPSERTHFSECHDNIEAYGLPAHRHAAEIEQEVGTAVTFVPHLVPLNRGIFETIYAMAAPGVSDEDVARTYTDAYGDAPFVRLRRGRLPEIKDVAYTNFCDIGWHLDPLNQRLVIAACLDNLIKGAAGQAIQNFNIAYGYDERAGLP